MLPLQPSLTPVQREVLRYLRDCDQRGVHPTYREVAGHFGWKAVATVRDHLRALAAKGVVVLSGGRSRSLQITPQGLALAKAGHLPRADQAVEGNSVGRLARDLVALLGPFLHRERFPAGAFLWHEGEPAHRCIILDRGRIAASRQLPSGRSVTTCLRGPGEIVGFIPLFDGGGYPTTVQALEEVEARVLGRAELLRAVQDGETGLLMFQLFAQRIREAFRTIDQLGQRSAVPRVAAALMALVQERPRPGRLLVVTLPLASATLAGALGLAPETFSRSISHLVGEGVLHRLSPRRYQVLDVDGLNRHAQATE